MADAPKQIWPNRLRLRDTGLHDDMGGGGQRIYTTAGRGYEKQNYLRADLIDMDVLRRVEAALDNCVEKEAEYMRTNNLGDPEKQHTVRYGRAALAAIRALKSTTQP